VSATFEVLWTYPIVLTVRITISIKNLRTLVLPLVAAVSLVVAVGHDQADAMYPIAVVPGEVRTIATELHLL
jgi:hypothetical protein